MDSEILCVYCDTKVDAKDKNCSVCNAEINKKFSNVVLNSEIPNTETKRTNIRVTEEEIVTASGDKLIARGGMVRDTENKNEKVKLKAVNQKEASWICSKCTFINDSINVCCEVCFIQRNASGASLKKPLVEVWSCPKCRFDNSLETVCCDACHHIKDSDVINKYEVRSKIENSLINNENIEKKDQKVDCNPWRTWECMECSHLNTLLALRCFSCERNNQIYRLCRSCHIYFIFNDVDTSCLDCLPQKVTNDLNIEFAVPEGSLQTESNTDKPQKHKEKNGIFSSLQVGHKNKFVCKSCKSISKTNRPHCKKCGSINPDFDCLRDDSAEDAKTVVSLRKLSSSRFNFLKFGGKNWYCSDENCRSKNKSKSKKCKNCDLTRIA